MNTLWDNPARLPRDHEARFLAFHAQNPQVFALFARFAREARDAGLQHYSAQAIIERIRWHCDVEIRGAWSFKIDHYFRTKYARLLVETDPSYTGFFEFRQQLKKGA